MKELGLIDGKIVDLGEHLISMEDRGYQFGDGIYEVTSVFDGKLFMLEEHLDRLYSSAEKIKLEIPYTREEIIGFHELLLKESGIKNTGIYLQITRGAAPRKHNFPVGIKPVLTMAIRPGDPAGAEKRAKGIEALLVDDIRWLRCDIKTLNLLGNVLAKQEAYEAGKGEAIQHRDGIVTEGSSTNFYVVKDGVLHTHPANNLILPGITRIAVLKLCRENGIKVVEEPFTVDFMNQADEAFITGTTTEIMPITKISDVVIGEGTRGPVTQKLQELYTNMIKNA